MTNTITTRRDLDTWLFNAGGLDADDRVRLADHIQADDHPAWGADWTEYLDALDLTAIAAELATDTTIAATARACAATLREQGWQGGGITYDLGAYPGDAEALADALGREPTREERRALESAIRIELDERAS